MSLLANRITALPADERAILESLVGRMEAGRRQYGPWNVDDGRDYPSEAFEEIVDALHYCAAELVRRSRHKHGPGTGRKRVYVCHPYGADPVGNTRRAKLIARQIVEEGKLPIATHLALGQFLDESTERDLALELCLELLTTCDEVRVYGGKITPGMRLEIVHARALGIPLRYFGEVKS